MIQIHVMGILFLDQTLVHSCDPLTISTINTNSRHFSGQSVVCYTIKLSPQSYYKLGNYGLVKVILILFYKTFLAVCQCHVVQYLELSHKLTFTSPLFIFNGSFLQPLKAQWIIYTDPRSRHLKKHWYNTIYSRLISNV